MAGARVLDFVGWGWGGMEGMRNDRFDTLPLGRRSAVAGILYNFRLCNRLKLTITMSASNMCVKNNLAVLKGHDLTRFRLRIQRIFIDILMLRATHLNRVTTQEPVQMAVHLLFDMKFAKNVRRLTFCYTLGG